MVLGSRSGGGDGPGRVRLCAVQKLLGKAIVSDGRFQRREHIANGDGRYQRRGAGSLGLVIGERQVEDGEVLFVGGLLRPAGQADVGEHGRRRQRGNDGNRCQKLDESERVGAPGA